MSRKITKQTVEHAKEILKLYEQQTKDSGKSQGGFWRGRNLRDKYNDKARMESGQSARNSCGY